MKLAGKNFEKKYSNKHTGNYRTMNKDNSYVLKYPNANKLFLYFNKKVDEQLMNFILKKVDNKKIAGINYRDNGCIITFYNKKNRDEMMERKVFDDFDMIDKGYFSMNECNLKVVVEHDRVSEVILTIEQSNLKKSIKCFTQRLLNKEDNNSKVVLRFGASNTIIKASLLKLNWIKVNDLDKDKPCIKLHSKKLLSFPIIIQGIYNAWDRIVEERSSSIINEKDITINTAYTKIKKELRYNYIVQLENYDIANILYGQFIMVDGSNYKLKNPSETFSIDKNKNISNQQKENSLRNIMEDCPVKLDPNPNNITITEETNLITDNIQKVNYEDHYHNSNNNDKQDLNSILNKFIESNSYLCSTVQNMSSNIEMLHKEIKMINNRVDALKCEGKRSRNIIEEDSSMCKSSKSNLYY